MPNCCPAAVLPLNAHTSDHEDIECTIARRGDDLLDAGVIYLLSRFRIGSEAHSVVRMARSQAHTHAHTAVLALIWVVLLV